MSFHLVDTNYKRCMQNDNKKVSNCKQIARQHLATSNDMSMYSGGHKNLEARHSARLRRGRGEPGEKITHLVWFGILQNLVALCHTMWACVAIQEIGALVLRSLSSWPRLT